jgi:hypothetical protein
MYDCEPNGHGACENGSQWIEFIKKDGELFRHGRAQGEYSTDEMRTLPLSSLTSGFITKAKALFDATATEYSPDDILSRYPSECVVWAGAAHDLASEWKRRYGEDIDLRKALGTVKDVDYAAAEMPGGRCITHKLPGSNQCEIRENS